MKSPWNSDTPMGVRLPAVAGLFYPEQSATLGREIESLFARVNVARLDGAIVALVAPHAGYEYSGFTAAIAYKLLVGTTFETVVIVAPSHREYFDGISVFDGTSYLTPLGELKIDDEMRARLVADNPHIRASSLGHRREHAVEVQLPFLQTVLRDVKVLPIVMGEQRREYCFRLAERLADVCSSKRVLLVASTDLSHYHPYDEANVLDQVAIDDVARIDHEQLMVDLETERTEACGGGPTVAVLAASKALGANRAEILYHCNSGDVTNDRSTVVGYLSAVVVRSN